MKYKLLLLDIDGTLRPGSCERVPKENAEAVCAVQKAGVKIAIATGRGRIGVGKGLLRSIRPDYWVCAGGAQLVDYKGADLALHRLTTEEMYALVDFCEDYNYPLQFDFKDGYYAYCEYDYLKACYDHMNAPGLECIDGEDQDRHLIDMPHAAFAAVPPEHVADFAAKYGHLGLHWMQVGGEMPGGWCSFDIVRGGIDKGVGLADLCARMGLTLDDAVAAGDSANDIGMLKAAGLSCCMANGTPEAKAAAKRVIGDVREDGVAALIEELWFDGPRAEPSGKDFGSAWGNIESAGGSL